MDKLDKVTLSTAITDLTLLKDFFFKIGSRFENQCNVCHVYKIKDLMFLKRTVIFKLVFKNIMQTVRVKIQHFLNL